MSVLKKISAEANFEYDNDLKLLYGEKYGYKFAIQQNSNNNLILFLSVKENSAGSDLTEHQKEIKSLPTVANASFKNYKLTAWLKMGMTKNKTKENVLQAIDDVIEYLRRHNFVECCEATGVTENVNLYIIGTQISFLSPEAYQQRSQGIDELEQKEFARKENVFLGIIGVFLGSLIGVAAIVLISQLGYVSSFSGIIMGVCTIKGYELLGKKVSKKGALISLIIVVGMTYFANQLNWAVAVSRYFEVSVFDVFPDVNYLVSEGYIDSSAYYTNMVMLFLFTLVTAVIVIFSTLNGQKTKYDIRKLY